MADKADYHDIHPLSPAESELAAAAPPARPGIVIHAEATWYDSVVQGKFVFFQKLARRAQREGYLTHAVRAKTALSDALLLADHAHIILAPNFRAARPALHTTPSYVWGFWYLDTLGVNWNSSLVDEPFRPDTIDEKGARFFFNGVTGYMLRENISKFSQSKTASAPLPPARAVIFLQEIDKYQTPVHFLDTQKMVATVAKSTAERVYVKLHPAQSEQHKKRYTSICARFPNVEVSQRSIHDLSKASDIVVTQNSAAGFEALMQRKPVITCAQSDFHHATLVARNPTELREALITAPTALAGFPFEKYFYWFLGLHMLEPQKDDFEDRAWRRIAPLLP